MKFNKTLMALDTVGECVISAALLPVWLVILVTLAPVMDLIFWRRRKQRIQKLTGQNSKI